MCSSDLYYPSYSYYYPGYTSYYYPGYRMWR